MTFLYMLVHPYACNIAMISTKANKDWHVTQRKDMTFLCQLGKRSYLCFIRGRAVQTEIHCERGLSILIFSLCFSSSSRDNERKALSKSLFIKNGEACLSSYEQTTTGDQTQHHRLERFKLQSRKISTILQNIWKTNQIKIKIQRSIM